MPASVSILLSAARDVLRNTGQRIWDLVAAPYGQDVCREKQKLVILGSGWGGYSLSKDIDKKLWDVIVVSPLPYFNFTPLLPSAAVGNVDFRAVVEPVHYVKDITFYRGLAQNINFREKSVECRPAFEQTIHGADKPFSINYDKLVIAVGCESQTFHIEGVEENALFLRDVDDAKAIRGRVLECFEQAVQPDISEEARSNLLHFVLIGGGSTGAEFAAELHDAIAADLKRRYPSLANRARISIYDVAEHILPGFDMELRKYAEGEFKRENVSVHGCRHIKRVDKDRMIVEEEGEIPFGLLIWNTGLATNPLVDSINEVEKQPKTRNLTTNGRMRVLRKDSKEPFDDEFAIGDMATIDGQQLPPVAQAADQEARYLAENLNLMAKGQPSFLKGFQFQTMGNLAYVGDREAIYEEDHTSYKTGRMSWALWKGAVYSGRLSAKNKALVGFYWLLTSAFGRDVITV